jgi:hypothetical protein
MGHIIHVNEETQLGEVQRRLLDEFPSVSPPVVATLIRAEHARFEGSRIRDFVPLFVEKRARSDLKAIPN